VSIARDEPLRSLESSRIYQLVKTKEARLVIQHVFDEARKRLKRVDELFSDFTSHGIDHAVRTVNNLAYSLEKCGALNRLTQDDLLVLICAALLHDIGMGPIDDDEMSSFVTKGVSSDTKAGWRKEHHDRAQRCITTSTELGFVPDILRARVGRVARGHREVNLLRDDDLVAHPDDAFLAASLRLADQMDLSPARVEERLITKGVLDRILQGATSEEERKQLREFLKSFAAKKWALVFSNGPPSIALVSEIRLDGLTIATLDALESLVDDIEATLEEVKDVPFQGSKLLPGSLHHDFHVLGEASPNHVLRAHLPRVWDYLNLFLYPDRDRPSIAVREAVANAIDACVVQTSINPDSDCLVRVRHLRDRVVVEDNGTGMALRTIEEHFKVLGSSYYDSPSFKSSPLIRGPVPVIGQFGIGVFTYLMVCEHFEAITSAEGGPCYRILMSKRFGVTTAEQNEARGRGTTLTLLRPNTEEWALDDPEKLYQILVSMFPRPRAKVLYESDGVVREIGLLRMKLEEAIRTVGDLTQIRFVAEGSSNTLQYGVLLELQAGASAVPRSYDRVVRLYHLFARARQSTLSDRQPVISLFEGMSVSTRELELHPFLYALLSLAHAFPEADCESMGLVVPAAKGSAWLDFSRKHAEVDLPKRELTPDSTCLELALRSLDETCKKLCMQIMSSKVDWVVKERLRWAFLYRLNARGPGDYDINWMTDESVIDSFVAPLVCLDGDSRAYLEFRDVLNSPLGRTIVLWPVGRLLDWAFDDQLWHQFRLLYFLDHFRRRDRVQSVVGSESRKAKKQVGKNEEDRLVCLVPLVDSTFGSPRSLAYLLKKNGHDRVMTDQVFSY